MPAHPPRQGGTHHAERGQREPAGKPRRHRHHLAHHEESEPAAMHTRMAFTPRSHGQERSSTYGTAGFQW
jgi:hypothetical protein